MSQEAYRLFTPDLKEGGLLLVDTDLVRLENLQPRIRVYGVPATRLAEELGKRMVLNVVMVGFFTAVTELLQPQSVRQAVADSVPPAFKDLNLRAFDKGYQYGLAPEPTSRPACPDSASVSEMPHAGEHHR
jgi:2-oxoglutarate ferredoxin oxidoreductase subunit gamma